MCTIVHLPGTKRDYRNLPKESITKSQICIGQLTTVISQHSAEKSRRTSVNFNYTFPFSGKRPFSFGRGGGQSCSPFSLFVGDALTPPPSPSGMST